jgi:hypothetical protein
MYTHFLSLGLEHLEGVDPFGHFAQARDCFFQAQALAQGEPDLVVAAFGRRAGDDQVTDPARPRKVIGLAPWLTAKRVISPRPG